MPVINFVTNVAIPNEQVFTLELSKLAAAALGNPETLISVVVTCNETLSFAGSLNPAFSMAIAGSGNISPTSNKKYSQLFSNFVTKKLDIPNDRGYITFVDFKRTHIGFKGTTMEVLVGSKL